MKAGRVVVGAAAAAAKSMRNREKPQAIYLTAAARNRLRQLAHDMPESDRSENAATASTSTTTPSAAPAAPSRAQGSASDALTAATASFKLGLRSRGCNGLAYTLDYHDKAPARFEEVVEEEGVRLIIDSKALMFVIGTTMDFVETPTGSEFVFLNPNASGTCGCGESFSVDGGEPGGFEKELMTELEKLKAKKDADKMQDVD